AAIAVDAQAQRDDVGVEVFEGAFHDRVEMTLSAEAEAGQIPPQPAGDQGRPSEARSSRGGALGDRTAIGDPAWPARQRGTQISAAELQLPDGAESRMRKPEADLVNTRWKRDVNAVFAVP